MAVIKLLKQCKKCGERYYYKQHILNHAEHLLQHKRNYWKITHRFTCVKCGLSYTTTTKVPFEQHLYHWDVQNGRLVKNQVRRGMRRTSFGWTRI